MKITQLHPHFYAEVTGADLSQPLDDTAFDLIQRAIDDHAVLVFRDQQHLDDDAQIAFSARFGPLQKSITVHREDIERRLKRDELSDISNVDEQGNAIPPDDRRSQLQRPAKLWHTDSSFRKPSGRYTFLAARVLPPEGGDTEFADMRAAYDALDGNVRERIETLEVEHSLGRSRALADAPPLSDSEAATLTPTVQPLVRLHPGSGRKALYLASHAERVVGMEEGAGRALLDRLTAFATTPEFVHRHRWQEGDLVMWDNRCTMHRATPFDQRFRRDMRRTTVADDD